MSVRVQLRHGNREIRWGTANDTNAPVAVPATGTLTDCFIVGNEAVGFCTFTIFVGAGAISNFQITKAAVGGGTHVVWLTGSAFSTASARNPDSPGYSATAGANSVFQIDLDLTGIAEIKIQVASTAGTTIGLEAGGRMANG